MVVSKQQAAGAYWRCRVRQNRGRAKRDSGSLWHFRRVLAAPVRRAPVAHRAAAAHACAFVCLFLYFRFLHRLSLASAAHSAYLGEEYFLVMSPGDSITVRCSCALKRQQLVGALTAHIFIDKRWRQAFIGNCDGDDRKEINLLLRAITLTVV